MSASAMERRELTVSVTSCLFFGEPRPRRIGLRVLTLSNNGARGLRQAFRMRFVMICYPVGENECSMGPYILCQSLVLRDPTSLLTRN